MVRGIELEYGNHVDTQCLFSNANHVRDESAGKNERLRTIKRDRERGRENDTLKLK